MKKALLCLVSAVLLIVFSVPALAADAAAPTQSDTPVYTLTNMVYGNSRIRGTAVHDDSTPIAPRLYARVTVFFVGGSYAIFSDYVEDGVIDIDCGCAYPQYGGQLGCLRLEDFTEFYSADGIVTAAEAAVWKEEQEAKKYHIQHQKDQ